MDLPQSGPGTWATILGSAGAALIVLRRVLSGQAVDLANNNAQINMIATLQAERDAAVKRADEAAAARDAAIAATSDLKIQIATLQNQVTQLTVEVAALRAASGEVAKA